MRKNRGAVECKILRKVTSNPEKEKRGSLLPNGNGNCLGNAYAVEGRFLILLLIIILLSENPEKGD
jgi:hypothetical protein